MRLAIFVSLALAAGLASFSASACDTRFDYSNKINRLQAEYQLAVDQANKAYVEKAMYSVRSHGANLLDWSNSVNAAVDRYTRQTQETYDYFMTNACLCGNKVAYTRALRIDIATAASLTERAGHTCATITDLIDLIACR